MTGRGPRACARRTPIGSSSRLGESITNLDSATLERVVLSPADIEALNMNLVGGDIYGGSCALDQNLLWRPLAEAPGHETAVVGLWHIGASTHPGPGLGAGSGYLVAKELTKPPITQPLLSRIPGRSCSHVPHVARPARPVDALVPTPTAPLRLRPRVRRCRTASG